MATLIWVTPKDRPEAQERAYLLLSQDRYFWYVCYVSNPLDRCDLRKADWTFERITYSHDTGGGFLMDQVGQAGSTPVTLAEAPVLPGQKGDKV